MKIPAMVQALTEMAVVGALTVMGFAAMITGGFSFTGLTTSTASFMGMPITSLCKLLPWRRTYCRRIPAWRNCNPAPVQRVPWTRLETGQDAHAHRRMRVFEHDCRSRDVVCIN